MKRLKQHLQFRQAMAANGFWLKIEKKWLLDPKAVLCQKECKGGW